MSQRELWMAGNFFNHVDRIALGLYALGDLLQSAKTADLEECTLNNLGYIVYEIGAALSQTTESAVKNCNFPETGSQ